MDYFLLCILARLGLVGAALTSSLQTSLFYFLIVVASAWILMHVGVIRRDKGPEANGVIWWKDLRIVHASMYLLAAVSLHIGWNRFAAVVLLADVSYGTRKRYAYRLV